MLFRESGGAHSTVPVSIRGSWIELTALLQERPIDGARMEGAMSLGLILLILVIIYLVGGVSGRFGGYGYGMGHSGIGLGGVILVVLIVLLLLGKL